MLTVAPYIQAGALFLAWVAFTFWCYRQVIARSIEVREHTDADTIVAFASESGSAESLSQQLVKMLRSQGAKVLHLPLNQVTSERLTKSRSLFAIASTYGEGDAPDNGRFFIPSIKKTTACYPELCFSILGLGDTSYEHFCGFSYDINTILLERDAQVLAPLVAVDRNDPETIASWFAQLAEAGVIHSDQLSAMEFSDRAPVNPHYSLTFKGRRHLNSGSLGAPIFEVTLETLNQFSWQAGDIVQLHMKGQIREYSIASIPEESELMLLVREQNHPDGTRGLGSGWLCHQAATLDSVDVSIRCNPSFHCSADVEKLILVGNGSGLAGLRAHLKARELSDQHDNWLIFGERSPLFDRHWDDQLTAWYESGHLSYFNRSYSRAESSELASVAGEASVGYVQDVVAENSERLTRWVNAGATILVCGSRDGMAQDLDHQLCTILGGDQVEALTAAGRYRRDVY
ncbi:sulfite reductase (NADPH) flavoprotein alpha-component [Thalassolituus maritimus]|uniref:NADPH--hemoprotein reductase n=1 Tax=Thalassolituus maritimus TaxID=484498 RepID=A0A1N7IXJ0_9GAMM|nr:sulfite reductase subunit alpha [Thalassolituus maritimus]SIS41711.1 sulfite reductase (NADPH) flavoprotein alpha-component [Thalassolituus maritimus]